MRVVGSCKMSQNVEINRDNASKQLSDLVIVAKWIKMAARGRKQTIDGLEYGCKKGVILCLCRGY